jgi:membrane protease YdiL (CAAX protease family)
MTNTAQSRRCIAVGVAFVAGCTLLGIAFSTTPGDRSFYPLLLGVAAVYTVGGIASGPLPWRGTAPAPRSIAVAAAVGVAAGAVFVLGALVIREIAPLRDFAADALDHERRANATLVVALTLLNGVSEEIFFRGAVYSAAPRAKVAVTTAAYVAATVATGNPLLMFAAAVMGAVFAHARRRSGGILAPVVVHLIWSVIVLAALPPIIG